MKKKKIAIIGAGNAACITAFHYYLMISSSGDSYEPISIYYDSSIPIEKVGQGSTLDYTTLLYNAFGFDLYSNNPIKAIRKDGILYENWGNKKDKIFHGFPLGNYSIHSVPNLLSNFTLESGLFNVFDKNITNPEKEIDADYIFDCRGKNNRDPELYDKLINPLNHVILAKKDIFDSELTYTRCIATPHGWTFVIPNYNSVSYGYLFNDTITTIEEAKQNFIELFNVVPDDDFGFENYIAKNCFSGERTILNGNRLCFLEPLEATSNAFYSFVARKSSEYVINGVNDKESLNMNIKNEMKKIETFVLWHYQKGSKYKTPFWEYAKSLPFNSNDEFVSIINYVARKSDFECRNPCPNEPLGQFEEYGQWHYPSFKIWYENT